MCNGKQIPAIGLGTWQSSEKEVYDAVLVALKEGYRHIDTAYAYGNENAIGKAIKASGIPRQEIFVTTKLWSTYHHNPEVGLELSLNNLGLDYVDLYLIHWPVAMNPHGNDPKFPTLEDGLRDILPDVDFVDTYNKLQKLVTTGKAKSIGVSNLSKTNLKKLLDAETTTIKPVVNQVELHPYLPQHELLKFAKEHDIYLEAYSPLGSSDSTLLTDKKLTEIADKYNVSVATLLISWAEARGTIVLPKSVTPSRIKSNLQVVDLDAEDVEKIDNFHKESGIRRLINPDWSPIKVFDSDL